MLTMSLIGAGRIGSLHAQTLDQDPRVHLKYIVDENQDAADKITQNYKASAVSLDTAIQDTTVDAVIIASPTPTHYPIILKACEHNKAIFCEKPIDLSILKVRECCERIQSAGVPFMVGFNRRFDPCFAQLKAQIEHNKIGRLEHLSITSRDPNLPSLDYIRSSGGLFHDMTIHDFDMASWLLPQKPKYLFAMGSVQIDSALYDYHDIDSAQIILKTESGCLCQINNSRRAVYGYDQRIEAFGSQGLLRAENPIENMLKFQDSNGQQVGKIPYFFMQRYQKAYELEMNHFISCLLQNKAILTNELDGFQALVLAEAAKTSLRLQQPINLPEFEKQYIDERIEA